MTKIKTYTLLSMLSLCLFGAAWGQKYQTHIDSLEAWLPEVTGKNRVQVLRNLCYYYSFIDFEQAEKYGQEAVALSGSLDDDIMLAKAYKDLGIAYLHGGRLELSLNYGQRALAIFQKAKDKENEAFILHNLGITYLNKGNYTLALQYLFEALEAKTQLGVINTDNTLYSIGEAYRDMKDYDKALDYYTQALERAQSKGDEVSIGNILSNMEIIYRKRGDFETALDYRKRVITINKKTGDDYGLAISYNNLGELYSAQNKMDDAILYLQRSLTIKKRMDNLKGIAHTSEELGLAYTKLRDYDRANAYAMEALAIAKKIKDRKKELDITLTLAQIHQAFGLYEPALQYHMTYTVLKDAIFNETKESIMAEMETKYQTSKKEAENELLRVQSEQQATTIRQKNLLVIVSVVGLSLLAILSLLLFNAYRQKTRGNQLLSRQKETLSKLNATKNRFFGIIAHDLRGPVTALQGIASLLSYHIKNGNQESLNKIATQIETSAHSVNTLLDNLLKWAMSQEGAMPYHPQTLAVKPLIEENVGYFKDMATAKGITLKTDIPKNLQVHGDKETLSTVFRNLINNGIKFTPTGGSIQLKGLYQEGKVRIDVKDNGKGIPEEKLDKLFSLHTHFTTEGTRTEKGTGLGLILVHDFLQLNKGSISIASKRDQGSTFSITLPSKLATAE